VPAGATATHKVDDEHDTDTADRDPNHTDVAPAAVAKPVPDTDTATPPDIGPAAGNTPDTTTPDPSAASIDPAADTAAAAEPNPHTIAATATNTHSRTHTRATATLQPLTNTINAPIQTGHT
jgi:hypothetical protein